MLAANRNENNTFTDIHITPDRIVCCCLDRVCAVRGRIFGNDMNDRIKLAEAMGWTPLDLKLTGSWMPPGVTLDTHVMHIERVQEIEQNGKGDGNGVDRQLQQMRAAPRQLDPEETLLTMHVTQVQDAGDHDAERQADWHRHQDQIRNS